MFGIDEGAGGTAFLGFGDDRQGQRGLTRRFRAIDLDDTAFWQAADAKGNIQAQGAGGDGRNAWRSWSPMRMTAPLPNWRSI